MSEDRYSGEVERALARPHAEQMCRQLIAYADYFAAGAGSWPEDLSDDFNEITGCYLDDPEKSFAYVVLAASLTDDAAFLGLMAAMNLEDLLDDPSPELLDRIVAEAEQSARFRWLLSHPYKVAIADRAWDAIKGFRITGPHALPPR